MPSNMVLRFRDFVADTIPEHRKYINDFGYVWWGWWNKPNEKIPKKEFFSFQQIIHSKGYMWIYLVDSGTERLHKAKLIEIDISDDGGAKGCRETDKIPEYYKTTKCKVWFRFANIEDVIPDEISGWSYVNPTGFTYRDDDESLENKRIDNISEMLNQQHRTLYFITPYNHQLHQTGVSKNRDNLNDELENIVNEILKLIEAINKQCDYAPKRMFSPIQIPPYPKEIEDSLKSPAYDNLLLKDFSNHIYQLIVDGHRQVLKEDRAIIRKSSFLGFAGHLVDKIKIFRDAAHHLDVGEKKKIMVGDLYFKVCGKRVLDDEDSRIKFQFELLKETRRVLNKELDLVKERIAL